MSEVHCAWSDERCADSVGGRENRRGKRWVRESRRRNRWSFEVGGPTFLPVIRGTPLASARLHAPSSLPLSASHQMDNNRLADFQLQVVGLPTT